MIPAVRQAYNAAFRPDDYARFGEVVATACGEAPTFRLAETPVFLPDYFAHDLLRATEAISERLADPAVLDATAAAIREPYWSVPGDLGRPNFLQYDFAVCRDADGRLTPGLIELQGFPSLYFFQAELARAYRQTLPIPYGYRAFFGGHDEGSYLQLLRDVIIGGHQPEQVILLEIEPRTQNTRIDFRATHNLIRLPTVALEELRRDGRQLSYLAEDGREVAVKRIYNRVILDELLGKRIDDYAYSLREEVDVEWAGHPDWFLRISKHTLPALHALPGVPETIFAADYLPGSRKLGEYVLKPLYSFSGAGVNIHPTEADVAALERPGNWILQRRVAYEPVLETPSGPAKCEVRMMLVWRDGAPRAECVNNLVRITKGEMTGVKYNRDKDWVGASLALHTTG